MTPNISLFGKPPGTSLKCIMHISSNPLAGKPVVPGIPPENFSVISRRFNLKHLTCYTK